MKSVKRKKLVGCAWAGAPVATTVATIRTIIVRIILVRFALLKLLLLAIFTVRVRLTRHLTRSSGNKLYYQSFG